MRKLLFLTVFTLAVWSGNAQQGTNAIVATDAKIALFGSDNQYTHHRPIFNALVMLEHINKPKGKRIVGFVGGKYVNLSRKYYALFMGLGVAVPLAPKLYAIPSLEGVLIMREVKHKSNPGSISAGASLDFRYVLGDHFAITARPNVELATDLPGRLLRYQGTVGVAITNIFK